MKSIKFIKRHEIGQNYKNKISFYFFIILTDFVTFNRFCVLNEKPARNRQILAHNSSGLDFLNYTTSCID